MKLTIAIPTFERAGCLLLLLASIQQDLVGIATDVVEVMVIDNASQDDTPILVNAMRKMMPHLRCGRQPSNVGLEVNIATCIQHGIGEFLWIMGDDDTIDAGTIRKVLETIDHNPDVDFIGLNYRQTKDFETSLLPSVIEIAEDFKGPFRDFLSVDGSNQIVAFVTSCVVRRRCYAAVDPITLARFGSSYILQFAIMASVINSIAYVFATPMLSQRQGNQRPFDSRLPNHETFGPPLRNFYGRLRATEYVLGLGRVRLEDFAALNYRETLEPGRPSNTVWSLWDDYVKKAILDGSALADFATFQKMSELLWVVTDKEVAAKLEHLFALARKIYDSFMLVTKA
jgi:glycosyltransferase involved in cell wall biosynthesis